MTPTIEQAIEIIRQLPPPERVKIRDWIDENKERTEVENDEKFKLALQWIDVHRREYDGQFVLLDGDRLIAHGTNPGELYEKARKIGIQSPFVKRIKAEISPFGGW